MRITDGLKRASDQKRKNAGVYSILFFLATDYYVINNTRNIHAHVKWWKREGGGGQFPIMNSLGERSEEFTPNGPF